MQGMEIDRKNLQNKWIDLFCDFCGEREAEKLWDNVVRCKHCGLVYLSPRPEDVGSFYDAHYTAYHPISGIKRFAKKFLLMREMWILGAFLPKHPLVLDVGCGGGEDVAFFNHRGWRATGTDAMPEAAVQAKQELGVDVVVGTLEDLHFPDATFDLVRMKFSLSHVVSPDRTIQEVFRILKPSGLFSVWVPNFDSWGRKMFGNNWIGGAPYTGQMWNFSEKTLIRYLLKNNLKILTVKHSIVPNTFVHSLKIPYNMLTLLLFLPLSIVAAFVRQSDRIIITAHK